MVPACEPTSILFVRSGSAVQAGQQRLQATQDGPCDAILTINVEHAHVVHAYGDGGESVQSSTTRNACACGAQVE